MAWTNVSALAATASGIQWTPARLQRCDPYLVWADSTTHVAASPNTAPDIDVLVELPAAGDFDAFLAAMNGAPGGGGARQFWPTGVEHLRDSRFVCGFVTVQGLQHLVDSVASGTLPRFSLQESRRRPVLEASDVLGDALLGDNRVPSQTHLEPSGADGVYLGIVDDGLPVQRLLHAMDAANQPAHLWDQGWQRWGAKNGHTANSHWQGGWEVVTNATAPGGSSPRGFFYGRRLNAPTPVALAAGMRGGHFYRIVDYFNPMPRQTHGASVLGLMAPWTNGARGPVTMPAHICGLAMVQLPSSTVEDTSGGSLAARALDALRYIVWQEQQDRPVDGRPRQIVANISYGVHAGPHDGTSMFEQALLEMLDAHPHLHVVLPAGNAGRNGCHARRTLARAGTAGDAAAITLRVLPDHQGDSFVEFWMPADAEIELSIRPPGSAQGYPIRLGDAKVMVDTGAGQHTVSFGAVYPLQAAQGTAGRMVLLAIGATWRVPHALCGQTKGANQHERCAVFAPAGLWILTLTNLSETSTIVDAWVERSDAAPDHSSGGRQAWFPDSCLPAVRSGNTEPVGTLNGLATATHDRLHVVGAMRVDGVLSAYSAAGPARSPSTRSAPDAVAPADWSRAMPGLRTTAFADGAVSRVNGTSAACAVYARALALQLANAPATLPTAPLPPGTPPEIECTADSQPVAGLVERGNGVRALYPFEVVP